ncbi:MAG: thioredoxin family protein [bacterium]
MALAKLSIGAPAPKFSNLLCVDGKSYSMEDFDDKKILIVAFTCNHCPYVQAYEDRLIEIQNEYRDKGVQLIAINSNETEHYPKDDFDHMVNRAKEKGFNFPYLRDETQRVAAAYYARVTPEMFVLDQERRLRYHGRIDDNWEFPEEVESADLRNALDELLASKEVSTPETRAVGCTIKWAANYA